MVSNSVLCGNEMMLNWLKGPKGAEMPFPTLLPHHHQTVPFIRGRMDPCIRAVYTKLALPSACCSRNSVVQPGDAFTRFNSAALVVTCQLSPLLPVLHW